MRNRVRTVIKSVANFRNYKRQKSIYLNSDRFQRGGAIFILLTLLAVWSTVTVAALVILNRSYSYQSYLDRRAEIQQIKKSIENELVNDAFCRCNLRNISFSGGTSEAVEEDGVDRTGLVSGSESLEVSLSSLKLYRFQPEPNCPTGEDWLTAGESIEAQNDLTVDYIKFTDIETFVGNRYRADLEVGFVNDDGPSMAPVRIEDFIISTTSTGSVEKCKTGPYAYLGDQLFEKTFSHEAIANTPVYYEKSWSFSVAEYKHLKALSATGICDFQGKNSSGMVIIYFMGEFGKLSEFLACDLGPDTGNYRTAAAGSSVFVVPENTRTVKIWSFFIDTFATGYTQRTTAILRGLQ